MTTWRTRKIRSAARIAPGTSESTRSLAPQITSVGLGHPRQERFHRMPEAAAQGPQNALLPLPVLEFPLERPDQFRHGKLIAEEHRLDQAP